MLANRPHVHHNLVRAILNLRRILPRGVHLLPIDIPRDALARPFEAVVMHLLRGIEL